MRAQAYTRPDRPRKSGRKAPEKQPETTGYLSISEAATWMARNVPPFKKPHVSTITRWATRGCRGRRLRTVRHGGGGLYVSLVDLQTFVAEVAQASNVVLPPAVEAARLMLERDALDAALGKGGAK